MFAYIANTKLTKQKSGISSINLPALTTALEIQHAIETVAATTSLYEEKNFDKRLDAIDLIEFEIIYRLETLLSQSAETDKLIALKHRAEKVKTELEEIDTNLFQKLQTGLRTGEYTREPLKTMVYKYVDFCECDNTATAGYDTLDVFINGLTHLATIPAQTKQLEPGMVYYQKTPARIIFELTAQCDFGNDDIFFDLGSGLGQAAILVNLLTGVTVKGIEFEPAFCHYATACAANLNLTGVTFINTDARAADYTKGTVFFMFTPFRGQMMQEVLEMLWKESLSRKIRIITYGPCTAQVALQSWLSSAAPADDNVYRLHIFNSL
ncbi:hypothetical protein [Mucilaginibacter sp. FT3.2]|uniref:hypothetical protein n=1 Tax=Mucilaginibacter sp. FT3.2 TaxID=2723090 RepID=UPI00161BAA7E|nr:hypothetical protein [Mucilaginibacter sp. FT3.2]MBB6233393.1 hypothetical protein [Mucilaginibacter sp. FT3.2]